MKPNTNLYVNVKNKSQTIENESGKVLYKINQDEFDFLYFDLGYHFAQRGMYRYLIIPHGTIKNSQ